ncbi:unnamed protein product [Prunus armeniaca]
MHEDLVLRVKSIAKKSPAIGLEESRRSERPDDNSCLLVVGGAHADIIPPSSSNSGKSYLCASPSSWVLPLAWAKVAHWNWLFGLDSPQPRAWAPRWSCSKARSPRTQVNSNSEGCDKQLKEA